MAAAGSPNFHAFGTLESTPDPGSGDNTSAAPEEKRQTGNNESAPKTSNEVSPKPVATSTPTQNVNESNPKPAATRPTTQNVNESTPKPAHQPNPQRVRVGGAVQAAKLVNRVQPVYPPLARQTRVSGTVKLHAIIGKDGTVEQLDLLEGHPLLVQSAVDAVKQWRYQPTLLNREPVEVDTEIDVIFSLAQ